MRRREFIKTVGAAGIACTGLGACAGGSRKEHDVADDDDAKRLAAPCGLYCGICLDHRRGVCHGCGCGPSRSRSSGPPSRAAGWSGSATRSARIPSAPSQTRAPCRPRIRQVPFQLVVAPRAVQVPR